MPIYEFFCIDCGNDFEDLAKCDDTGIYPSVVCPKCGSKNKKKTPSGFAFNFGNPEGTDRWNSDTSGHDYRFKTKLPHAEAERKIAENFSHVGTQPYNPIIDSNKYDTGIHDV